MRLKWRRRLIRSGKVIVLYVGGIMLTLVMVAGPWRYTRPAGVMVSTRPRPAAQPAAPVVGPSPAGTWIDALTRGLCRLSLRICLPWPALLEETGEELPFGGGIQEMLFRLLGIGGSTPGNLLATGIPVIRHLNVDVYASRAQARARPPGRDLPYTAVITHMPAAGAAPWLPESPLVAVYHTHARESYLPELPEANVMRPDDAHSDDLSLTVVRVGKEIAVALDSVYGIGSVHSLEMHDNEGKLGAYVKSEATVGGILNEYPTIRLVLDVHRDSQPRERTTVEVKGERLAKVMVVIGTDNPGWKSNHAVATELLKTLETRYPGISAGIYPKPGRFNQQYSPGGLVLEVGGVENTLDECLRTGRAVAWAIYEMVRIGKVQV
ncbi:MAG: stage II sporulation protein P [Firmicutes bacterium]|nr:stage II sporulation protein P [Bacillota bacterium]